MPDERHTSSMSHRVTFSTDLCFRASRMTPPSPPPTTSTLLGLGWAAKGMWAIISWYLFHKPWSSEKAQGDVRELVSLGALNDTVQNQDMAVSLRSEDQDVLPVSEGCTERVPWCVPGTETSRGEESP